MEGLRLDEYFSDIDCGSEFGRIKLIGALCLVYYKEKYRLEKGFYKTYNDSSKRTEIRKEISKFTDDIKETIDFIIKLMSDIFETTVNDKELEKFLNRFNDKYDSDYFQKISSIQFIYTDIESLSLYGKDQKACSLSEICLNEFIKKDDIISIRYQNIRSKMIACGIIPPEVAKSFDNDPANEGFLKKKYFIRMISVALLLSLGTIEKGLFSVMLDITALSEYAIPSEHSNIRYTNAEHFSGVNKRKALVVFGFTDGAPGSEFLKEFTDKIADKPSGIPNTQFTKIMNIDGLLIYHQKDTVRSPIQCICEYIIRWWIALDNRPKEGYDIIIDSGIDTAAINYIQDFFSSKKTNIYIVDNDRPFITPVSAKKDRAGLTKEQIIDFYCGTMYLNSDNSQSSKTSKAILKYLTE